MTHELTGGYPATNYREQVGRFLRHAFSLGHEFFSVLVSKDGESDSEDASYMGGSSIEKKLVLIH